MINLYENYNKQKQQDNELDLLSKANELLVANSWISQAVTFGSNSMYDDTVGTWDEGFSLTDSETKELLKQYGVNSKEQIESLNLTDIRNRQQLEARLRRYSRITEAHKTTEELYGKVGSMALGALTSIATDPTTLVGGTAIKATTKAGEIGAAIAEGAAFGASDAMVYNEASGYQQIDPMTATLFGAGAGGVLHSFALTASHVSAKVHGELEPIDTIATQANIEAKKQEIADKEAELAGLKASNATVDGIDKNIAKLEEDIIKHTKDLEGSKKAYAELTKTLDIPGVDKAADDFLKIKKLKEEITLHEQQLADSKKAYEAMNKDIKLDKISKDYITSVNLRQEINKAKKEYNTLKKTIKETEAKVKKTDDLLQKKTAKLEDLKREEKALLEAKNTHKSRGTVQGAKYKTKNVKTHREIKDILKTGVTKHNKDLKEIRAKISKVEKEVAKLRKEHKANLAVHSKVNHTFSKLEQNVKNLTEKYSKIPKKPKHITVQHINDHIKTKGLMDDTKAYKYYKTLETHKKNKDTLPDIIARKKSLIKIIGSRKPKHISNKQIEAYIAKGALDKSTVAKYEKTLNKHKDNIDKLPNYIARKKDLLKKLKKRRNTISKGIKDTEVAITNHLTELNKELKELISGGSFEQKLAQASKGKLETVMGIALTPITMLQKSNNPAVRGLGNLMAPPYKALVDSDGNYIATKMTAVAYKSKIDGMWIDTTSELQNIYNKARANGEYTKSFKEFMVDIVKEHRRAVSDTIREEFEKIRTSNLDNEKLIEAYRNIEATCKPKFSDDVIGKGAERFSNYFISMGELGKELGVSGFKDISTNGMYLPRKISFSKLQSDREGARRTLFKAMKEHPVNYLKTDEDIWKSVDEVLSKVQSNNILNKFLDRVGEPTTSQQNARTIFYYEDMMEDYLEQNGQEIGQAYSYAMSGRFAGQKMFGVSTVPEMKVMLQNVSKNHEIDHKEIKALHASFDTLFGIRELDTNPGTLGSKFSRIWTKLASIVLGPGFVVNSLAEFSNIVATTGIVPVMKNLFPAIPETVKLFKGDKLSKPYMNELRTLGFLGKLVRDRHFQRWDGTDSLQTEGWLEDKLAIGSHLVYKYSGLQALTEATRVVSLASGLHFIIDSANRYVNKGLSVNDMKRLYRLGLDETILKHIVKHIEDGVIKFDKDGNLLELNFKSMNKELADTMENAIFNHLNSTVLEPNGFTLPMFMTESSPLTKIVFQFMRYPFAMIEQLGLKGLSEMDIKQINGIISNFMLFTLVSQIKDIGANDPRYDLSTDKGVANTFNFVMGNNYMIGSLWSIGDLSARMLTGKSINGDYTTGTNVFLGASGSILRDTQKTIASIKDGELKKAIGWLPNPAAHILGLGNIFKELQKDLRNE